MKHVTVNKNKAKKGSERQRGTTRKRSTCICVVIYLQDLPDARVSHTPTPGPIYQTEDHHRKKKRWEAKAQYRPSRRGRQMWCTEDRRRRPILTTCRRQPPARGQTLLAQTAVRVCTRSHEKQNHSLSLRAFPGKHDRVCAVVDRIRHITNFGPATESTQGTEKRQRSAGR